jgi:pantoate--beta-alanine ligase
MGVELPLLYLVALLPGVLGRKTEWNNMIEIISSKQKLRERLSQLRAEGKKIGFVPTMGALHDGHLTLVAEAKKKVPFVVTSIFVNPTQFGPNEDFAKYPRDIEGDSKKVESVGCDLVFAPSVDEVYPKPFFTFVEVSEVSEGLCGAFRPGHFRGVATVVAKLFGMVSPDVAFFGEKDYQQLAVIKSMVRDLDMNIEIVGCPTIREPSGLAMSSRNAYLSASERQRAESISKGLYLAVEARRAGETDAAKLCGIAKEKFASFVDVLQYIEVRDAETLAPIETVERPARILVAAKIGNTRLIDNMAL